MRTAQLLTFLVLAGLIGIILRLAQLRLLLLNRFFSLYVIVLASELAVLLIIPFDSNASGYAYFFFQSLNLLIAGGVVAEIYQLALASHPALAAFGRTIVIWAIAGAAVVAAFSMVLDSQVIPGQSLIVHRFITGERTIDFIVLLLLLMIGIYLTWFPIKLNRNMLIYAAGFAAFFLARASGLLIINLLPQPYLRPISNLALVLEFVCILFWIWGFRRESEDASTVTGHRWNPGEIERLVKQLDAINKALERFKRPKRQQMVS